MYPINKEGREQQASLAPECASTNCPGLYLLSLPFGLPETALICFSEKLLLFPLMIHFNPLSSPCVLTVRCSGLPLVLCIFLSEASGLPSAVQVAAVRQSRCFYRYS